MSTETRGPTPEEMGIPEQKTSEQKQQMITELGGYFMMSGGLQGRKKMVLSSQE
jgi:hypothetical protein